jgi:hypothetical protein
MEYNEDVASQEKDTQQEADSQPQEQTTQSPKHFTNRLFEYFLVVGISSNHNDLQTGKYFDPQLLYQYPPKTTYPLHFLMQNVPDRVRLSFSKIGAFCFPSGVHISSVKRTPSESSLNEVLFGQPHVLNSKHYHVFRLTAEDTTVLYGICVTKYELVQVCITNARLNLVGNAQLHKRRWTIEKS